MNLKPLGLMVALSLTGSTVSAAPWATYDARSGGMGGLSVVTSDTNSAPFTNPALLSLSTQKGLNALSINGGLTAGDPQDLIGATQTFQDGYTALQNYLGGSPDPGTAQDMVDDLDASLAAMGGKPIISDVAAAIASNFEMGDWHGAISLNTTISGDSGVTAADGTPSIIFTYPTASTDAELTAVLVQTQELSFSLARNLPLSDDFELAYGISPKIQNIMVGEGSQALNVADPTNINNLDITYSTGAVNFNTDAGVVLSMFENIRLGVSARNLLASSYTTVSSRTVSIEPQIRAGLAYSSNAFTLGVDMDLVENSSYISSAKSRYMIVGTEFNAGDVAQLRLGYRNNTLDANDQQVSLGVGLAHGISLGVMTNPNNIQSNVSGYVNFNIL